ncbi:MAG: hypothetical protein M9959_12680 [Chitinophagaceae bacterium]|nr:hypothetical protein [Chitinophagaceae bacterium]
MYLLIAHLIYCKGSILRISRWIENSTIKEVIGLDELTSTECCMMLWIIWMNVILTLVEQSIFEYWLQLDPSDNKAFVLDVTDTYYNGKHDLSTQRVKMVKFPKLIQIGLGVSFGTDFLFFTNPITEIFPI